MQLDRVQIQVRERGHLEILDLSLAVLRKHWLGLGMSAALGVVPMMMFNTLMMPAADGMEGFFLLPLILIELPWATALVTLYLGHVTFSDHVSAWGIARSLGRSLWQLFVLQGIFRTLLALLSGLVLPFLFLVLGMKYLNEIILLERGSFRQTLRRQSSFHRAIGGRLFGETLINTLLGTMMTLFLSKGIIAITDLLVKFRPWQPTWAEFEDPSLLLGILFPIERWEGQLAIWLVLCFFTVTRYLSYLDHRIRSEGWEVELKLRAQGARIAAEAWA